MKIKEYLNGKAEDFSNFENFENFEDYCYTGQGDDLVDFVGYNTNFASMFDPHNQDSRTFTISVSVGTSFTGSGIQLFGDLWSGAENSAYSFLTGTGIMTGITVNSSPKSVAKLYSFLQNNPTVLQGIQIVSSNSAVLQGIITTYETSPFRDLATDPINLSAYTNPYQFNSSMVLVPQINKVVSNQTYWLIPCTALSAAYDIVINLYFGAAINLSNTLDKKIMKAKKGIQQLGGSAVVKALDNTNAVISEAIKADINTVNMSPAQLKAAITARTAPTDIAQRAALRLK